VLESLKPGQTFVFWRGKGGFAEEFQANGSTRPGPRIAFWTERRRDWLLTFVLIPGSRHLLRQEQAARAVAENQTQMAVIIEARPDIGSRKLDLIFAAIFWRQANVGPVDYIAAPSRVNDAARDRTTVVATAAIGRVPIMSEQHQCKCEFHYLILSSRAACAISPARNSLTEPLSRHRNRAF
jgi:hypothetical protein